MYLLHALFIACFCNWRTYYTHTHKIKMYRHTNKARKRVRVELHIHTNPLSNGVPPCFLVTFSFPCTLSDVQSFLHLIMAPWTPVVAAVAFDSYRTTMTSITCVTLCESSVLGRICSSFSNQKLDMPISTTSFWQTLSGAFVSCAEEEPVSHYLRDTQQKRYLSQNGLFHFILIIAKAIKPFISVTSHKYLNWRCLTLFASWLVDLAASDLILLASHHHWLIL